MSKTLLLKSIAQLIKELRLRCRVKTSYNDDVSDWSPYIGNPSGSYFEFKSAGPVEERDIEWIEIDPVMTTRRGRLVADLKEDKKALLISALVERKVFFDDLGEFVRANLEHDPGKPPMS